VGEKIRPKAETHFVNQQHGGPRVFVVFLAVWIMASDYVGRTNHLPKILGVATVFLACRLSWRTLGNWRAMRTYLGVEADSPCGFREMLLAVAF